MKEGLLQVAVDAVVFTVMENELKVLLIKRKKHPFEGRFALPGGFVKEDENLEAAAQRELTEETNVKNIFLHQLGAYGDVERDPRGRIISIAYMALVRSDQPLKSSHDAAEAKWFSVYSLPQLAFDHRKIIDDALRELRLEIQTTNIAFQILPEKFTLTQMQQLYELVLNKEFDKRNFRKKLKEIGILKITHETKMEGAHRPAMLYSFKEKEYRPVKDKVHVFV